jgi:hypothetical protein
MGLLHNLATYDGFDIWKLIDGDSLEPFNTDFITKTYDNLVLVKYRKNNLYSQNSQTLGLWRSVVLDTKNKKIVSFAPPKSLEWGSFSKTNSLNGCITTKFEEGTMCNLFFNEEVENWDICTRSGIGGRYKFFQDLEKTFRYMFLEAMNHVGLEFGMLKKDLCYSFVLQHPDNRIVVPHKNMQLVLTNVYSFKNMCVIEHTRDLFNIEEDLESKVKIIMENILTPLTTIDTGGNWPELFKEYQRMDRQYTDVGIQVYNPCTGFRTKLRNPSYEQVKYLKGNSPKIQFQYYNLRRANKVKEFLKYYPEYKNEFSRLREELHKWTDQLFTNYHNCYIKKTKPLRNFAYQFKPHIYKLHKIYLDELRSMGSYVSKQEVIGYVNSLHPAKLMHGINYPHRKNTIDIIAHNTKLEDEKESVDFRKK